MINSSWAQASSGLASLLLTIAAVVTIVLVWRAHTPRSVKTGQTVIVVSTLAAMFALAGYIAEAQLTQAFDDWVLVNVFAAAAIGAVAFLALPKAPANLAVWTLAVTGFFSSLQTIGAFLATTGGVSNAAVQDGEVAMAPTDLDLAAAIGVNLAAWTWIPAVFLLATYGLLLFPGGRLPSRRWRWVAWAAGTAIAFLAVSVSWVLRPWSEESYADIVAEWDAFLGPGLLILLICSVASIVAVVLTWRRSAGDERLQFRWAGSSLVFFAVGAVLIYPISTDGFRVFGTFIALPIVFMAYGIAITKFRLYDIDIVVSRALVYGVLAALITITYVAIVAVPVLVLGVGDESGANEGPPPVLAIGATAVIAIAFQPARRWLEQAVNRIVYGKRATPYEVLSEFSQRVAATDYDLLDRVPESLVAGTSAERAAVWARTGPTWTRTTAFPPATEAGPFPGFTASGNGLVSVPVEHDGETMGAVTLTAPHSQRLSRDDERLAHQVASGMGLALRNQRLTDDLQRRVNELRTSRRRIVSVQDDTRRTLERNLHDGAQQQLVAVKVKLGIARQIAERDTAPATVAALDTISQDADGAIDEMRSFARGIYPPLLEAEGLIPAITAHARRLPLTVDITHHHIGRYHRDMESTIYFCIVEALTNITAHTTATTANIILTEDSGMLSFTVTDPGPGYNPTTTPSGTGHTMMTDRLNTIAGTLTTTSTPTGPTAIIGTIPTEKESR